MTTLRAVLIAAIGAFLLPANDVQAQHHHHGHGHFHGSSRNYHFYVRPPDQFGGSYYTYNDVNYFVPVAVASADGDLFDLQPVVARFGGYSHLDDLAARLEDLANSFCLDLHYNYQHNPGYAETYREAYQILTTAKYIHGSEHAGDRVAIRQTVGRLDDLFHHVVDDVRPWTRHQHREIEPLTFGGKINEMESLIHHLMYDVGVKPAHDEAPAQVPQTPPPSSGSQPPQGVPAPPSAPFTIPGSSQPNQ